MITALQAQITPICEVDRTGIRVVVGRRLADVNVSAVLIDLPRPNCRDVPSRRNNPHHIRKSERRILGYAFPERSPRSHVLSRGKFRYVPFSVASRSAEPGLRFRGVRAFLPSA